MTDILIYTKEVCPFCDRAKALFRAKGASYTAIGITGDEARRGEMIAATGGKTVPQTFIGEHHARKPLGERICRELQRPATG